MFAAVYSLLLGELLRCNSLISYKWPQKAELHLSRGTYF